jgi:hypothetical protein
MPSQGSCPDGRWFQDLLWLHRGMRAKISLARILVNAATLKFGLAIATYSRPNLLAGTATLCLGLTCSQVFDVGFEATP